MAHLGIIGGTGLTSMPELVIDRREMIKTPWGAPSGPVLHGKLNGVPLTFLARHGRGHTIPPHRVNYRANIQAMVDTGVFPLAGTRVRGHRADISVTADGGAHDFLHMTLKMGVGREEAVKADVAEAIYAAAEAWLKPRLKICRLPVQQIAQPILRQLLKLPGQVHRHIVPGRHLILDPVPVGRDIAVRSHNGNPGRLR